MSVTVRYASLKRYLAKRFHPDYAPGQGIEKIVRNEIFKESRPPAARRRDQLRRPDRAIRRSARPSTTRTLRGLRSFLEHHAFSRQVVPFRLLRLELVCPLPQRRSGVQVTFFDPGRPSDFPELRGAVRPHAFGWHALFPVRYLWSLLRWEGQCMGAVGEPRKRPHCLMCFGYGGD